MCRTRAEQGNGRIPGRTHLYKKDLYLVHFAIDSAYNWWQMVKIGITAQNGKKFAKKNRRRGAEQQHRAKIFEIRGPVAV